MKLSFKIRKKEKRRRKKNVIEQLYLDINFSKLRINYDINTDLNPSMFLRAIPVPLTTALKGSSAT